MSKNQQNSYQNTLVLSAAKFLPEYVSSFLPECNVFFLGLVSCKGLFHDKHLIQSQTIVLDKFAKLLLERLYRFCSS